MIWESFKGRQPESGTFIRVAELSSALVGVNSTIAERADACTRRCNATAGCNAVVVPRFIGSRAHQRCYMHASVEMGSSKPTTLFDTYRLAVARPTEAATSESLSPISSTGPQDEQGSLAQSVPFTRSVSIALCVVGVASHAAMDKAEKPGFHSFPIHDERTYRGLASWRTRLRALGVSGQGSHRGRTLS